jgi:hypothetical protein
MIATYTVEYSQRFHSHLQVSHYFSDDPVTCEAFIAELLERGLQIRAIRHNGVDLAPGEFDRFVRIGASKMASDRICSSLGIKTDEEHFRFGFTS